MVTAPVKTEQLIDTAEANKMLRLLGVGLTDAVIICCYGSGGNKYFPKRKRNRNYNWAEVKLLARDGNRARLFEQAEKALRDPKTNSLGWITSAGGSAKKGRKEVTVGHLLVYEIDSDAGIKAKLII